MDSDISALHLEVGRICGEERTCGTKIQHETLENAERAADAHNKWRKKRHDVQPYPCHFCKQWHIGGVMTVEDLERIIELGEVPPVAES